MAYRAFHGMKRQALQTSTGKATGGIYGFIMTLEAVKEAASGNPLVATFDAPGPTFRHEKFEAYKATREKMPDELREQLPQMQRIVEANGIPVFIVPGFEADDIMATLARWVTSHGHGCFLVTSDKDMAQLVDEHVHLLPPPRAGQIVILGSPEVKEKYGVPPSLMGDFLALTGDSSDNIPGIPGVGPKRAVKLLEMFGTLHGVLEHWREIPWNAIRDAFEKHADLALLSRELVQLRTDVPLEMGSYLLECGKADANELVRIYTELEFGSLAMRVQVDAKPEITRSYHTVTTEEALDRLITILRGHGPFAFDLETTSLDPMKAVPIGISLSLCEGEAYYVPLGEEGLSTNIVWEKLGPLLEDEHLAKGGQNSKYDMEVLQEVGIRVRGLAFDTMIASYLVEPNLRQRNLDFLSLRHLGIKKIPTEQLIGKGKSQITMDLVPVDEVAEYACEDADMALRLHHHFEPKLAAMELEELYRDVELPLINVLCAMERRGICLDVPYVHRLGLDFGAQIVTLEREIKELAGEEFNVNSTKQLGYILFEKLEVHKKLGIKRLRRTKSGYSTNAAVLETMAEHPLVARIMEYRNLAKLKSTYVDTLPKLVHPRTGRIHTSFNQAVAATGRLSSSNPNLQNIPIRGELGKKVRKAFVAPPGYVLLVADYSQIELRMLAHLAQDKELSDAFASGMDIHAETAARIFDVPPGDVSSELRTRAKAINFGVLYGMGPRRLARDTGITQAEASEFIQRYFHRFPAIKGYMDSTIQGARAEGGVRTILGRWRPLPDIEAMDGGRKQAAERMAINTPVQGSAADLMKIAMLSVHREICEQQMPAFLLLQVHDELVLEVEEEHAEETGAVVAAAMEGAMKLSVPLKVDVGWGANWLDAK